MSTQEKPASFTIDLIEQISNVQFFGELTQGSEILFLMELKFGELELILLMVLDPNSFSNSPPPRGFLLLTNLYPVKAIPISLQFKRSKAATANLNFQNYHSQYSPEYRL